MAEVEIPRIQLEPLLQPKREYEPLRPSSTAVVLLDEMIDALVPTDETLDIALTATAEGHEAPER